MSKASQLSFSTATSLIGGALGSIPYQNATSSTLFVSIGAAGTVLQSNGTEPIWAPAGGTTVGTSTQVQTVIRTTNAAHFLTFVDSNNASSTAEALYTTSSFSINPSNGAVNIGGNLTAPFLAASGGATLNQQLYVDMNGTAFAEAIALRGGSGASGGVYIRFSTATQTTSYFGQDKGIVGTSVDLTAYSTTGVGFRVHTGGNATPRLVITANGGVAFGGATNYGTAGQVLQSNGDAAPTWVPVSGTTVGTSTQVNTILQTASNAYYLTFVDSNNASATAEAVYTTSTFTINPATGFVGIGAQDGGSPLNVKVLSTLSGTINSFQKVFTTQASGGVGNNVYRTEWRRRRAAGTDWQTQNIHDGIWVDSSFTTPGTDTRTWWERDPNTTSQSWGDQATTWMFVNGTGLGIRTTTPSYALHVKSGAASGTLSLSGGAEATGGASYILMGNNDSGGVTGPTVIVSANRTLQFGHGTSFTLAGGGTFTSRMSITSNGGIAFGASASNYGTAGQVLQSNGDAAPTWVPVSGTTVGTSTQVTTVSRAFNGEHHLAFVDSNNASSTAELVYTTSSFTINPFTGNIQIGMTYNDYQPSSGGNHTIRLNAVNTSSIGFHDSGTTIGNIKFSGAFGFEIGAFDGLYGPHNTILHSNIIQNGVTGGGGNNLVLRGGTGAASEGPQIVLGYGNNTSSAITGQANYTWNIDIASGLANNNLRIFRQNSAGATVVGAEFTEADGGVQLVSLGVGTTSSGVTGEIRATNEITAYYSSDIRLKENIRLIADPITIVNQIRGVYHDWTDAHIKARGGEDGYFVRKHDIGVIAQEVEAVLPEIVATRVDGTKVVKYEKLVALLIEAVKDQQRQINQISQALQNLTIK